MRRGRSPASSWASSPRIGRYQAGWKPVARGESADNAPSQGKIATPEIRRAKNSMPHRSIRNTTPRRTSRFGKPSAVKGRISLPLSFSRSSHASAGRFAPALTFEHDSRAVHHADMRRLRKIRRSAGGELAIEFERRHPPRSTDQLRENGRVVADRRRHVRHAPPAAARRRRSTPHEARAGRCSGCAPAGCRSRHRCTGRPGQDPASRDNRRPSAQSATARARGSLPAPPRRRPPRPEGS